MNKKILIVSSFLAICLFLGGCGAKLENGEEAIVSFSDSSITADDFYTLLKEKYAADEIVDLIDETLLNKEYEKTTEEDVYVNENLESAKEQAGEDFNLYLQQYYNVDNESEFKDILRLTYKRNLWVQDYIESTVTDEEVETYYNEKVVGDMELSHILITPDVASDASDSEKTKAEEEAQKEAEEVIEKLNNGESFEDLAKEYSDDESNKNDGGSLGFINREGYDENFIEGAIPLEINEYTKEPVKSAYGYHIILKTDEKDKPELNDEEKEKIKTSIAEEKLNADSTLALTALEALRDKYEMKINDSDINKAYEDRVDEMYANNNASTEAESTN